MPFSLIIVAFHQRQPDGNGSDRATGIEFLGDTPQCLAQRSCVTSVAQDKIGPRDGNHVRLPGNFRRLRKHLIRFPVTPQKSQRFGKIPERGNIPRIELPGALQVKNRFLPMSATALNHAERAGHIGFVR